MLCTVGHRTRHITDRQCDAELAAPTRAFAVGVNRSALQLDETPRDSETDAESTFATTAGSREETEDACEILGRNTVSAVADTDPNQALNAMAG